MRRAFHFQLPASGKEKPPTIKNVPPRNTEGRTEIQLHKASYGKRKQKNLCQSKQSLQNKENISEKWAYRRGSGSSASIHPPASGGGLECAVLVNSVKFKFQVFQCK